NEGDVGNISKDLSVSEV
ncbi:hypothetical protein CLOM_g21534, partial [Closterium sp. NIES-68]